MNAPTDLARLIIAFQHALAGRPQGRLTPRIARSMMERQTGSIPEGRCLDSSITGEYACRSSWGLGFDVNLNRYLEHQPDSKPTGDYFGHTGFNSGYLTVLIASKEGGNGLVIMANSAPEDMSADVPQFSFMTRLVRQIADEEGWK